ncbi:MAG TPA: glycosyltransferase family 4 protein [Candidatus Acidoferrales bacterium]|nr:glycosyltransferase family 4 protein [Candidatus Acidoferrales bacterium]
MSGRESKTQQVRLIALFTELLAPGGVQLAGRMIAAGLSEIASRQGWTFELLSLNDRTGSNELTFASGGIPFRGFGRAKTSFVTSSLKAARKGSADNLKIVIAAHPNLAVPAAWMKKMTRNLKTVVVAHGIEVWEPMAAGRRRALQNATLVVAPSGYTVRKLSEIQGLAPGRIQRLPWPLDPAYLKLAESPEALPCPPNFPKGQVVLTVGRWAASERYKGADELIGAVGKLRAEFDGLQLAIVGSGDDVARLKQAAAASSAGDRIHFFEGLRREEVAACFARSELFALPSTGEGFGFVFLEAMTFGKAVIGAAAGGIPDLIEDGETGFLVPGRDAGKLAEAIRCLLRDEKLRRKMGRRGVEKVRMEYSFETFRGRLKEFLDQTRNNP